MTTETKRPGAHKFVALELAIEIVAGLRDVVEVIRKRDRDADVAKQIVRSASSIAANLAEAGGRQGKDRLHHFRIAAGSAHETVAHLRVAMAWGWIQQRDIDVVLGLLQREQAILWRLTH
jgi:four helix bundle protein